MVGLKQDYCLKDTEINKSNDKRKLSQRIMQSIGQGESFIGYLEGKQL